MAAIGLSRLAKEGQAAAAVLTDRFLGDDVPSRLWDLYLLGRTGQAAMRSIPAVVSEMTSANAEKRAVLFANNFWFMRPGIPRNSNGFWTPGK